MNATLITGASGGIGEAAAHQFASAKHNLVLVARNEASLQKLCLRLADMYQIEATYIVADLSKPNSAHDIYNECVTKNIFINTLINNAGSGSSGEFYKNDLESELAIIQLNNSSLVALSYLFLKGMIKNKSGYIINVASLAAFFPSPYMAVYAASKAFVKSFSQALTEECSPYGVKVMLFNPGLTESNFMNTKANDNQWGKVLVKDVKTQTCEEVAAEMFEAFKKQRTFQISGARNRIMIKMASLMPDKSIASMFAKQKRRQMGVN